MNNGQNGNVPYQDLNLVSLTGQNLVTPDNFRRNREQVEQARAALDRLERENVDGYERWVQMEQELRATIEAGRQAEQLLAHFHTPATVRTSDIQLITPSNHPPPAPTSSPVQHQYGHQAHYASYSVAHPTQGSHPAVAPQHVMYPVAHPSMFVPSNHHTHPPVIQHQPPPPLYQPHRVYPPAHQQPVAGPSTQRAPGGHHHSSNVHADEQRRQARLHAMQSQQGGANPPQYPQQARSVPSHHDAPTVAQPAQHSISNSREEAPTRRAEPNATAGPSENSTAPQSAAPVPTSKTKMETAAKSVYKIMKNSKADVVQHVVRLVCIKLKDKLVVHGTPLTVPPPVVISQMNENRAQLMAAAIAHLLQDFLPQEIVGILRFVGDAVRREDVQQPGPGPEEGATHRHPQVSTGTPSTGTAVPTYAGEASAQPISNPMSTPILPVGAASHAESHSGRPSTPGPSSAISPSQHPISSSPNTPVSATAPLPRTVLSPLSSQPNGPSASTPLAMSRPAMSQGVNQSAMQTVFRPPNYRPNDLVPAGPSTPQAGRPPYYHHLSQGAAGPSTPPSRHGASNGTSAGVMLRTPDKADRSRLARDILRSLGRPTRSVDSLSSSSSSPVPPTRPPADDANAAAAKRKRDNSPDDVVEKKQKVEDAQTEPTPNGLASQDPIIIDDDSEPAVEPSEASNNVAPTNGPTVDEIFDILFDEPREPTSPAQSDEQDHVQSSHSNEMDIEEVKTPGVIQMEEAQVEEALLERVAQFAQSSAEEIIPPSTDASEPTTPQLESIASPPPVSRSPTPRRELNDANPPSSSPTALPVPLPDFTTLDEPSHQEGEESQQEPLFVAFLKATAGSPTRKEEGPPEREDTPEPQTSFEPDLPDFPADPVQPAPGPSKEPLFLSSPPTSPIGDPDAFVPSGLLGHRVPTPPKSKDKGKGKARAHDSDIEVLDDDSDIEVIESSEPGEVDSSQETHKRKSVRSPPAALKNVPYVAVPPLSKRVKRLKASAENSASSSRSKTTTPSRAQPPKRKGHHVVLSDDEEEDELEDTRAVEVEVEVEEPQCCNSCFRDYVSNKRKLALDVEQAGKISSERMWARACQWRECGAVLQSGAQLGAHAGHHALDIQSPPYICQWEDCGRRFTDTETLKRHMDVHTQTDFICVFAGCEETFDTAEQLVHHHRHPKHRGKLFKVAPAHYFKLYLRPNPAPPPPPLPQTLPSYMSVPRQVQKARIPRDVHVWLGAKVAANISCYVHPGGRANAAVPSRGSRRLAEKIAAVERAAVEHGEDPVQALQRMSQGEYDSWIGYNSQRGPKHCDDIRSMDVTRLVEKGLVIGARYLKGDRRLDFTKKDPRGGTHDNVGDAPEAALALAAADAGDDQDAEGDLYESEEEAGDVMHAGPSSLSSATVAAAAAGTSARHDRAEVDEPHADAAAGTEDVMMLIEKDGDDRAPASSDMVQVQDTSIVDGDQVRNEDGRDASEPVSEAMSQPGWNFLPEEDADADESLV